MPHQRHTLKQNLNGRTVRVLSGAMDQQGYVSLELPSRSGFVRFHAMESGDENMFSKDNTSDPLKPFFELIKLRTQGFPTKMKGLNGSEGPDVNWRKVWLDDFTFALYIIRRLSYGDYFTFDYTCPVCKNSSAWTEDLSTTEILYASDEMAEQFKAKNPRLEYVTPMTKSKLVYRPLTAHDQYGIIEIARESSDRIKTESVRIRITDMNDKGACHDRDFESMPSAERQFFQQHLDSQEVGVVTTMQVNCPHCFAKPIVKLPIDGADFLVSPRDIRLRPDGLLSSLCLSKVENKSEMKSSSLPSSEKEQAQT